MWCSQPSMCNKVQNVDGKRELVQGLPEMIRNFAKLEPRERATLIAAAEEGWKGEIK